MLGKEEEARFISRKGVGCYFVMYLGANEKPLKNGRELHD